MTIFILIFWILFSSLEGIREGYYWFFKPKDIKEKHEHLVFTIQRTFVFSFIVILMLFIKISIFKTLITGISLMCVFPFIHDGFYYLTRNYLNPSDYPKRFLDSSTTSSAKIELSLIQRLALFISGLVLISTYYLI